MLMILQVATVFLVSIAWAQALAHALELPGKLRLGKDAYIAVQTIYYPASRSEARWERAWGCARRWPSSS